jgi:uncharacterized protein DUF4260
VISSITCGCALPHGLDHEGKGLNVFKNPRLLLHIEGACLFVLTLWFYYTGNYRWWIFAVLFFTPDLAMLGYLKDVKLGTTCYNFTHTLSLPVALLLIGLMGVAPRGIPYALIWLSHIEFDRMLGFGLKYATGFKDTHFQRV